jgi:hypothetical protein
MWEDVHERERTDTVGYRKVQGFVAYLKAHLPLIKWLWIDTCCIKQHSDRELSEAINSMFQWYRDAEVCLAYLEDVPTVSDMAVFEQSVWFRRGWTLQELLAPSVVVFLSQDWQVIGHKGHSGRGKSGMTMHTGPSLEDWVCIITSIPRAILHDYRASENVTSSEKLKWAEGRETTHAEDLSYCLLGIMGVSMNIRYGDGEARTRERLLRKLTKSHQRGAKDFWRSKMFTSTILCISLSVLVIAMYNAPGQAQLSAGTRTQTVPSLVTSEHNIEVSLQNASPLPEHDKYRVLFNLPSVPPTDRFVPRESEMHKVTNFFSTTNETRQRIFVVYGMGGMGKTQLCAEFVKRYQHRFTAVFWLDGSSRDALLQSMAEAALRLPSYQMAQPESDSTMPASAKVDLFLHWLSSTNNTRWLLVLDNIDRSWQASLEDPQAYNYPDFLPHADHGNILITTRLAQLQRPKASLHLGHVDDKLAEEIIGMWAGRNVNGTPQPSYEFTLSTN